MTPIGLYIHVPFCVSKCGYCDFYSLAAQNELMDAYTAAVCHSLHDWAVRLGGRPADTLYFGGGTPSLLGAERLCEILRCAKERFSLPPSAEVTLEANPADIESSDDKENLADTLIESARCGVNRLSLGVQSGVADELAALTRRHTLSDVINTVGCARQAGINNLSLDLMMGTPLQTEKSLSVSINFLSRLAPDHISAYLLKIEEGTPFFKNSVALSLPDGDTSADLYLYAVQALLKRGYRQYEISNFSRPGRESRHNLKYWNGEEYLGIGPSAHSFLGGVRFFYPANLSSFIKGAQSSAGSIMDTALPDNIEISGSGGDEAEYCMLRLRLSDGIRFSLYEAKFGKKPDPEIMRKSEKYIRAGLMVLEEDRLRLTPEGFLLSNSILADIL